MLPAHLITLFWDIDTQTFDPAAYPAYTIGRVLEYGDDEDVAWLRRTFSQAAITQVVRQDRRLSRPSANFWALVFDIPVTEVAALRNASE